jgi:hypothetical protein
VSDRAEFDGVGIDPYKTPGVTLLSYSGVVQRFAVGAMVKGEELERLCAARTAIRNVPSISIALRDQTCYDIK